MSGVESLVGLTESSFLASVRWARASLARRGTEKGIGVRCWSQAAVDDGPNLRPAAVL